jgi:hypothetical protein
MNIKMGNDEFILYIRKNYTRCKITNPILGKRIWQWIKRESPVNARIIQKSKLCYWAKKDCFFSDFGLPETATQFSFSRDILPRLYCFLDELGNERIAG